MPHDRDGRLLAVGDAVLVPCKVEQIHMTAEFCNVTLRTALPMYPSDRHDTIVLNSKQTVKGVAGESLEPVGDDATPLPEAVAAETAAVANEAANADSTADAKA